MGFGIDLNKRVHGRVSDRYDIQHTTNKPAKTYKSVWRLLSISSLWGAVFESGGRAAFRCRSGVAKANPAGLSNATDPESEYAWENADCLAATVFFPVFSLFSPCITCAKKFFKNDPNDGRFQTSARFYALAPNSILNSTSRVIYF